MSNIVLDDLRSKIDEIDTNLCQLIKERQSLASKIMSAKKGSFPFDPKREEELIKKLVNLGLDKFLVEKVWRQIISSNLSMQKVLKIGVAGNDDEININTEDPEFKEWKWEEHKNLSLHWICRSWI